MSAMIERFDYVGPHGEQWRKALPDGELVDAGELVAWLRGNPQATAQDVLAALGETTPVLPQAAP